MKKLDLSKVADEFESISEIEYIDIDETRKPEFRSSNEQGSSAEQGSTASLKQELNIIAGQI